MTLKEYYLTRSEQEIIENRKGEILNSFLGNDSHFRLIELGAGDGTKTQILLEHFVQSDTDFVYSPIDISESVLHQLRDSIEQAIPDLDIQPIQGEYFDALKALKGRTGKEVVMFLGSTIGNFGIEPGRQFLKSLGENLSNGDLLFIGFDLMKDPRTILAAYDDSEGVTKAFNLNLLTRINEELGADFKLDQFNHYPTYNPLTGETRSYLVSTQEQIVNIEALDFQLKLKQWEPIHTEISQKYSMEMIEEFARYAGFRVIEHFADSRNYFVDSLWEKI